MLNQWLRLRWVPYPPFFEGGIVEWPNNKLKEREEFPLVSIAFDGEINGIGLKIARLKKRIKKKGMW